MKIILTIESNGAAFADGNAPYEAARILRKFAERLEEDGLSPDSYALTDKNGNTVGQAVLT